MLSGTVSGTALGTVSATASATVSPTTCPKVYPTLYIMLSGTASGTGLVLDGEEAALERGGGLLCAMASATASPTVTVPPTVPYTTSCSTCYGICYAIWYYLGLDVEEAALERGGELAHCGICDAMHYVPPTVTPMATQSDLRLDVEEAALERGGELAVGVEERTPLQRPCGHAHGHAGAGQVTREVTWDMKSHVG
eukprot:3147158-Rhodomonas_salina.4